MHWTNRSHENYIHFQLVFRETLWISHHKSASPSRSLCDLHTVRWQTGQHTWCEHNTSEDEQPLPRGVHAGPNVHPALQTDPLWSKGNAGAQLTTPATSARVYVHTHTHTISCFFYTSGNHSTIPLFEHLQLFHSTLLCVLIITSLWTPNVFSF